MTPIERAQKDAKLYGVGFVVEGKYADLRHVIVYRPSSPDDQAMRKALGQYYAAAEEARSYLLGGVPADVQRRLIEARTTIQNILEAS
jgi:hypothetical protein